MLAIDPKTEATGAYSNWKNATQDALRACGAEVAKSLSAGDKAEEIQIAKLKSTAHSHSLKISVSDQKGFLKIFSNSELGRAAYERERASLCLLKDSGLVPLIRSYSDARHWVITEWIDVSAETYPVAFGSPVAFAYELGQWLARFDGIAPAQPATGNWLTYLRKLGDTLDLGRNPGAAETLSAIPLCGRALSRNDPALPNYLFASDGRVLGCDFEKAQLRPRGWDFIQGFGALIERFPEQVEDVLEAYAKGFATTHKGVLLVNELCAIARIYVCARISALGAPSEFELESIGWQ